jgi:hypothetical protein
MIMMTRDPKIDQNQIMTESCVAKIKMIYSKEVFKGKITIRKVGDHPFPVPLLPLPVSAGCSPPNSVSV